jgi:hypothetical protein
LGDELKEGNLANEEVKEQLEEFYRKGIFMPLDRLGDYFDYTTESLYNMYDVVFENENYLQLPATTP